MQAWFVRDEWQVHRRHSDFGGRHRFVQIKKGLVLVQRFLSGQLEDVRLWWFVLFSLLKESRAVLPNESLVCDAILAHLLAGASKRAFVQQRRSH